MKAKEQKHRMNFKKPQPPKRRSDGDAFDSPYNRKKPRSLSITVATPEVKKPETDPFDDNFSQFFRSQFIPELRTQEETKRNSPTNEYNFTQGFTQFWSQLDDSISAGQQCVSANETVNQVDDEQTNQNAENNDCPSEFCFDQNDNITTSDTEKEENDALDELGVQCSQLFMKELTELQMNITSIVNDTIKANRFDTEDLLDDQYDVFKSTVTQSQYLHRKRANESISVANLSAKISPKNVLTSNLPTNLNNTEMLEDQWLAQMANATQTVANNTELLENQFLAQYDELNVSEPLNDCIDPDSSALAHLLSDEDDKENNENVANATKNDQDKECSPANQKKNVVPSVPPVTAANFFSMGPFFGLPSSVKKLIKTVKNIDDLYGK